MLLKLVKPEHMIFEGIGVPLKRLAIVALLSRHAASQGESLPHIASNVQGDSIGVTRLRRYSLGALPWASPVAHGGVTAAPGAVAQRRRGPSALHTRITPVFWAVEFAAVTGTRPASGPRVGRRQRAVARLSRRGGPPHRPPA
jgi:hypothetical protein